jgi:hypothetical protein
MYVVYARNALRFGTDLRPGFDPVYLPFPQLVTSYWLVPKPPGDWDC